jgi:hypothetical protein
MPHISDVVGDFIERASDKLYLDPEQFNLFQVKRKYTPKGVSIVSAIKYNREDPLPIQVLHNYRRGTVTLVHKSIKLVGV